MLRKISNQELADIPVKWENPTCDTSKYVQNVMVAWECEKDQYESHKRAGGLCQKHGGKYYVA